MQYSYKKNMLIFALKDWDQITNFKYFTLYLTYFQKRWQFWNLCQTRFSETPINFYISDFFADLLVFTYSIVIQQSFLSVFLRLSRVFEQVFRDQKRIKTYWECSFSQKYKYKYIQDKIRFEWIYSSYHKGIIMNILTFSCKFIWKCSNIQWNSARGYKICRI